MYIIIYILHNRQESLYTPLVHHQGAAQAAQAAQAQAAQAAALSSAAAWLGEQVGWLSWWFVMGLGIYHLVI